MFLGHTSPMLCVLVNAIVVHIYAKINESRKRQLKVEILHNLIEF